MQNNFYFLRQLTPWLSQQLTGWELISCFSQNKNELTLAFGNAAREFYIRASLNPEFSCLSFPETYARSRKNSVDLFSEVTGAFATHVHQYQNERSFSIHFDNGYFLIFKMHGSRSNILLCHDNEVVALFKNKMVRDRTIKPDGLDREIQQTYEAFEREGYDYRKLFPTFDAVVRHFMEEEGYFELDHHKQWDFLAGLKNNLECPDFYYITEIKRKLNFSLLETGRIERKLVQPVEGLNLFYISYTKEYYLTKEKTEILNKLEQQLARTGNYIIKSRDKLQELETTARHEEIANIIMANIHNIPARAEEVELYDFYQNKPLLVKLKKDQSPQRNAEIYYRKAKNQKIEVKNIRENIYFREKDLRNLEKHIAALEHIDDIKDLRSYIKDHQLQKAKSSAEENLPYRHFIYQDYEILVGKNAKSNDELTQKYTRKDDLWLHARDVTGSHVVVRAKRGEPVPRPVIEKAAQLAAYYSKRKNDTLCPVLYTQKKYVRKPKGSHPGQVVVDREEVLLVTPDKSM